MKLTSEAVRKTFNDSLFAEGESTASAIIAEGITTDCGFSPERLKSQEANIEILLSQLPNEFKKDGGGGMSFLNMVVNKDGEQWTDFHSDAEQLLLLGLAIGKAHYNLSKPLWSALPGSMPYFYID